MAQLTRGIGKLVQIGVIKETTRGSTPAVTNAIWMAADDWTVDEKWKNAVDIQTYGVIEDNANQTRVKNWAEGTIKCPIGVSTAAVMFFSLLGTDTPTTHAGESVVYDHAITVAQTIQHQSLSIYIHDPIPTVNPGPTSDYSHANAVIHKIDIDYALGKFVELNVSLKAQKGSTAAVVFAPSQQMEARFVPQYLTFKMGTTAAVIATGSIIKLKSAKISFNTNEEDDDVLGSTTPRDFLNKELSCEGTIEAIFQNENDFKTLALNNTAMAMQFDLVNSDITYGVAANPEFKLLLYKVFFTEFGLPRKIKDVVYQTVKFKASYSLTDAAMVKATFTNCISAY